MGITRSSHSRHYGSSYHRILPEEVRLRPSQVRATNRLLSSKDHAAVQLNVGQVDQYGIYTNEYVVYCLSGAIRRQGASDFGLCRLAVRDGLMNARALK